MISGEAYLSYAMGQKVVENYGAHRSYEFAAFSLEACRLHGPGASAQIKFMIDGAIIHQMKRCIGNTV